MMNGDGVNIYNAIPIQGWMSRNELIWLAQTAQKSKVIVEFGCYLGRSTRAIADNTDGIIYAVDPWNGIYFNNNNEQIYILKDGAFYEFQKKLADHLKSGKVIQKRSYSYSFPPIESDFIFIDADHRYKEVKRDIEHALKMVKSGIISGHDYGDREWPGVKQAADEVFGQRIRVHETIWYVTI